MVRHHSQTIRPGGNDIFIPLNIQRVIPVLNDVGIGQHSSLEPWEIDLQYW